MTTKRYLDVRYDVTSLTDVEVGNLALEAVTQAEASRGLHPRVEVESEVVEVEDDSPPRTVLVHLNVELPPTAPATAEDVAREVSAALDVATDDPDASDHVPALAAGTWCIALAEEV